MLVMKMVDDKPVLASSYNSSESIARFDLAFILRSLPFHVYIS